MAVSAAITKVRKYSTSSAGLRKALVVSDARHRTGMLCANMSQNADLLSQRPHEHRCDNMYVHIVMSQAEWYGANQAWQETRHRLKCSARAPSFDCSGNMSVHPRSGGAGGVSHAAQVSGVSSWQRVTGWAARRR